MGMASASSRSASDFGSFKRLLGLGFGVLGLGVRDFGLSFGWWVESSLSLKP